MYKKSKSLSLVSSLSPFPKNLSAIYENQQKISICSTHKYQFHIITLKDWLESNTECKQICVETDKEVLVDKDYIIQIKWLSLNKTTVLAVLLHKGLRVYNSEGTEVLFSYSFASNPEECEENSHSSGIAALDSTNCAIFIGANNGSILRFSVNPEIKITFDETSNQSKHKRPITDLASDQKNRLISCDDCGKICVWDCISGQNGFKQLVSFEGYNGFSCNCVAIFKDCVLAGYGSGHLRVFDINNKSLICEISAHSKWVTAIDITSNGLVLSTSEDSFVRVWQLNEENSSLKVCHKYSQNIANHMLFGGVFLNCLGKGFCVGGYDSIELHCFQLDSCKTSFKR